MSYSDISEETLAELRKAQTNGVTSSSGLVGYDLSGVVSLVPVNTPTYDRTPRKDGDGSAAAHWKALLNVNNAQPNPFVGLDGGGNYVQISEQDVLATYQPVRVSGQVTRDAVALAKNYADAKSIASVSTLMQWRILDNKALLGGQNFALPAIGVATLTAGTSGSIPATSTVAVRVAARSGYNYYWGGSGAASTNNTVVTGGAANGSVTASVPAVKGAVAYDWYVNGFYDTTTTVNTATFTSVPTVNAATVPTLPDLFVTAPTAIPTVDTSFSTNAYNGYFATILGDYGSNGLVTPGTGTSSGATWTSLDGAVLAASSQGIAQIDNQLLAIYNEAQLSPTVMIMNAQEANNISRDAMGSPYAQTFLDPQNGRQQMTIGMSAGRYINRAAGGEIVEMVVDPHCPPGSILFLTERIPYPNSGIANTFECRTLQDVMQFDYGPQLIAGTAGGGPRDVWDQSSLETLVNRAPVTCGVISNISNG